METQELEFKSSTDPTGQNLRHHGGLIARTRPYANNTHSHTHAPVSKPNSSIHIISERSLDRLIRQMGPEQNLPPHPDVERLDLGCF